MAAERPVVEIELVPDVIINGLRNADRARLGECLEPGGDVDAIAKDVVAVDDHVAKIDANPQLQAALGRDRVVDRARGALHLDSAVQRIDNARKIRQHAITCGADDPSAMRRDQRVDGAPQFAKYAMRTGLIFAHQPTETGHIGVQDGGEFSLPRARFENFSHRPSADRPNTEASAHCQCV